LPVSAVADAGFFAAYASFAANMSGTSVFADRFGATAKEAIMPGRGVSWVHPTEASWMESMFGNDLAEEFGA
jgi:hypothetical protein